MKKNVAIFCPSGNFGGMELDSIKLSKKLNAHCNIVLVTKKGGFLEQNFDRYFTKEDDVKLESLAFKSFSFLDTILQTRKILHFTLVLLRISFKELISIKTKFFQKVLVQSII